MKLLLQMKSHQRVEGSQAFLRMLAGVALTIAAVILPVSLASAGIVSVVASTGQTLSVSDSGTTGTLLGCTSSCTISNLVIPSSDGTNPITILGNGTSALTGLASMTSVTIPSSVTTISSDSFESVGALGSVTIPSSVTSIGSSAFQSDTSMTSAIVNNNQISALEFSNDSGLTSITISNSVTSIASGAFQLATSLTSVTIPSSVTSILASAFIDDYSLTSVTIPSSVTSIASNVFRSDTSLTSITIPSSVTSIEQYAFLGDSDLASITIPSSVTSIGSQVFSNDTDLTSVYFLGNAPTFASTSGTFTTSGTFYLHTGTTGWNSTTEGYLSPLTLGTLSDAYSYNTNGGSTAPSSGSGNDGSTITLAVAPTESGFTFAGWNDGATTYPAGATYTLVSFGTAIVFTAQWTALPPAPQYVMDYFSYSDPSIGVVPQNGIGIDNTPITLAAAPVRSGYTFSGWNDGATTYPAGATYTLASKGNPILLSATWVPAASTTSTVTVSATSPEAPQLTSFVGTKNGLVATFSPSDQTATSFLCRISNGHNVFVRTTTLNQSSGQNSYECSFSALNAAWRYRVWVTALNQYGSSPFASTTAVTRH